MKKAFTIFIGFVHDFAAGIWLATVLAIWWIERSILPEVAEMLTLLQRQFFYIGIVSTCMVFLAGMGRTFTYAYIGTVYGEESEGQRRKMLMIKHVILLGIFGAGTYWQYTMCY